MVKFNKIRFSLTFICLLINFIIKSGDINYKIVGYYPNWAIHRTNTSLGNIAYYPKNIDANLLTHVIFAFLKHDKYGNIILDEKDKSCLGSDKVLIQISQLKQKYSHLKTLASIGGGTFSNQFSDMAANPIARRNFVINCINFCKKYNLDGIDIDWEFPGYKPNCGKPEDKKNFTFLLKELFTAFKQQNTKLLLTIAGPVGFSFLKNIELDQIHKFLDWINVMGYNYHGGWEETTGHLAALIDVDKTIQYYLQCNVPKEKIVLGAPLYGRSYENATGVGSSYQGAGSGTILKGVRYFFDIKHNLLKKYKYNWDNQACAAYLTGNNEFITFDDEKSLKLKCEYVKKNNLAGFMVWNLSFDIYNEAMKKIYDSLH